MLTLFCNLSVEAAFIYPIRVPLCWVLLITPCAWNLLTLVARSEGVTPVFLCSEKVITELPRLIQKWAPDHELWGLSGTCRSTQCKTPASGLCGPDFPCGTGRRFLSSKRMSMFCSLSPYRPPCPLTDLLVSNWTCTLCSQAVHSYGGLDPVLSFLCTLLLGYLLSSLCK